MTLNQEDALEAIRRALDLPRLSPSAIYDLRRKAIERNREANARALDRGWDANGKWWEVYPEGQIVAALQRIIAIVKPTAHPHAPWQEQGEDFLPDVGGAQ